MSSFYENKALEQYENMFLDPDTVAYDNEIQEELEEEENEPV